MESCWCEKRLPLKWCSFREESNFPRVWFRDLRIRFWGPEIKHLKGHNILFFLTLLSNNFEDQLSSNSHRFVILCICWDTPSEKTGIWQAHGVQCLKPKSGKHIIIVVVLICFPQIYEIGLWKTGEASKNSWDGRKLIWNNSLLYLRHDLVWSSVYGKLSLKNQFVGWRVETVNFVLLDYLWFYFVVLWRELNPEPNFIAQIVLSRIRFLLTFA